VNEKDITDRLKSSFLFSKLDTNEIKELIGKYNILQWNKNETIEYDTLKYTYIILDGHLKITKIDPKTGRSITLFILEAGDIYDFFTLLDGKEHIAFPVALQKVTAIKIPIEKMRLLIKENRDFNTNFLPYLGIKMRKLEDFGESMVFDDTATRLSKLILRHTLPNDKDNNSCHPVKLINNLSHEALAEMVGSVRSVITTQMQKLKKEDIIICSRGYLAIKNLEKLIKKCDDFFKQ